MGLRIQVYGTGQSPAHVYHGGENGHAVRWWLTAHLLHCLSFSVLHLRERSSIPLGDSPLRDYTVTIFRTITLPVSESFSFHDMITH